MSQPGETIFLAADGVLVTNARLVIGAQTYALAAITSTRIDRDKSRMERVVMFTMIPILIASVAAWRIVDSVAAGIVVLFLASLVFNVAIAAWPRYALTILTSATETAVLTDLALPDAERVLAAINAAIIARG